MKFRRRGGAPSGEIRVTASNSSYLGSLGKVPVEQVARKYGDPQKYRPPPPPPQSLNVRKYGDPFVNMGIPCINEEGNSLHCGRFCGRGIY